MAIKLGGALTAKNEKRRNSGYTHCHQCEAKLGRQNLIGIADDGVKRSFCSFNCTDKFNDAVKLNAPK